VFFSRADQDVESKIPGLFDRQLLEPPVFPAGDPAVLEEPIDVDHDFNGGSSPSSARVNRNGPVRQAEDRYGRRLSTQQSIVRRFEPVKLDFEVFDRWL
jgi:hypothetical protein